MRNDYEKQISKVSELAAMWFDKSLLIIRDESFVKRNRVVSGDRLRLVNGKEFVNCSDELMPNVEIVGCYGNVSNTILYFIVRDLRTNMKMKVNLILT